MEQREICARAWERDETNFPQIISLFRERTTSARLEYTGHNNFNLSYMRYTEEWIEVYPDLALDQCLNAIRDDPLFQP